MCNKIIIHFHGGAFISQSAKSFDMVTRKWANQLGVPVFSIDYRLAPKNPFPEPINDAYQGYYWLLTQCEHHFGIKPEKVIVTGDSAGGHIATAVVTLAILRGFRVPDSLLLHYPTGNCNPNHFFPSTMLTLDDPILGLPLMLYVGSAFARKGGDPSNNCLLSTIYTPASIWQKFPPVRMLACEVDPLRDNALYLAYNMRRAGANV